MYKEKRVKIPNSREIREILIKIHYLWKTNTHTDTHTHVVICFHFSIFEPLETAVLNILLCIISCDLLSLYYICCNLKYLI